MTNTECKPGQLSRSPLPEPGACSASQLLSQLFWSHCINHPLMNTRHIHLHRETEKMGQIAPQCHRGKSSSWNIYQATDPNLCFCYLADSFVRVFQPLFLHDSHFTAQTLETITRNTPCKGNVACMQYPNIQRASGHGITVAAKGNLHIQCKVKVPLSL